MLLTVGVDDNANGTDTRLTQTEGSLAVTIATKSCVCGSAGARVCGIAGVCVRERSLVCVWERWRAHVWDRWLWRSPYIAMKGRAGGGRIAR